VLHYDAGGRIALTLSRFYNVVRGKILEAGFRSDRAAIESLAGDFAALTEVWKQVEREVAGEAAPSGASTSIAAEAARAIEQAAEEITAGITTEG
jgi:flagellin-specific chaperone FliS